MGTRRLSVVRTHARAARVPKVHAWAPGYWQVETGLQRARAGSSSVYLKLQQAGWHGRLFEQELAR